MYFDLSKQEERFGLCIWMLNEGQKEMTNAFSDYK